MANAISFSEKLARTIQIMYNKLMDMRIWFKEDKKIYSIGLVVLGIITVICIAFAIYFMPWSWHKNKGYFQVQDNQTAVQVAQQLYQQGYISHPRLFVFIVRITGNAHTLRAGEYFITSHMSFYAMIHKFTSGHSEAYRIVIPEGYTVRQIAKVIALKGRISEKDFLQAANQDSLLYPYMKSTRPVVFKAEGFLFPDTYDIPYHAKAKDIVQVMLKNFDRKVPSTWRSKAKKQHLTVSEWVALASLVEREARYGKDRKPIAETFRQRLKIHMKLQSDASISYAMGTHKLGYSLSELQYDSPYNTYKYEGLPPGAICNPGLPCLEAALSEKETPYVYFVADREGHNHFATTYEDHLRNIQEYLR